MKHHATLSPSSLPMKAVCNHFVSGPAGKAAEAGVEQHKALEQAFKGEPITGAFDVGTIENLEWAFAAIKNTFAGYGVAAEDIESEIEVTITDDDLNELTFGTVDAGARVDGAFGVIGDYKSGEIRNYREQMEAYAVGFMQKYGLRECDAFIFFGRFRKVARYHFEIESAMESLTTLISRIQNPGPAMACEYCSWCAGAVDCPEIIKQVEMVLSTTKPVIDVIDPKTATPEQLSAMMDATYYVETWAEKVAAEVKSRLVSGLAVPGFRLQEKAGRASVTDIAKAVEVLALPVPAFLKACSVSIPKLADEYAVANGIKKKDARAAVEERLQAIIERASPSVSVVREKE